MKMSDKFKIFVGKVVAIWLINGFYRQGKVMETAENYLILDDRKDGISYLDGNEIRKISMVKNDR